MASQVQATMWTKRREESHGAHSNMTNDTPRGRPEWDWESKGLQMGRLREGEPRPVLGNSQSCVLGIWFPTG